jgi:type III restriction enzyme
MGSLNHFDYVDDADLRNYVKRVINGFNPEDMEKVKQNPLSAAEKIKRKITQLSDVFAFQRFSNLIDANSIFIHPSWSFPSAINALETISGLPKMLYEKEEKPNGFELKVINEVAQLSNIIFWHRNIDKSSKERKGFFLNGWINHYPDFIIYTESKNLILLETKGDDRDNSDSTEKLKLGKKWEAKCGSNFKYFMVFENNSLPDAHRVDDFIGILKRL